MKKNLQIGLGLLLLMAIAAAAVWVLRPQTVANDAASATLDGLRRDANTEKFARATEPREFQFPADHGPHDAFQTEWWYYTGNLTDENGRHFGYQLTFFRRALVPPDEQASVLSRPSDLAFTQLYFAHFAITDTGDNKHVSFDKFSRAAAGLAGAQAQPFSVFIEDWSARTTMGIGSAEAVQLMAQRDGYGLQLDLNLSKPIVLHGDRGLSQKSNEAGNASYYYSMTRMATKGKISTPQGTFGVTGESWLDREWSTSALDQDTAGWDWFSLQLDDQREIMFYQLRRQDGSSADVSKGTYIDADGGTQLIQRDDVQIEVLDQWKSAYSGANYPIKWRFVVPKYGLDVTITPRVQDQEMKLSQQYWEGAVTVQGTATGQPIGGVGYVELTGYSADSLTTPR